ncbi:MAG: hypothetical protein QXK37_05685 [Candidatus Woesearchaeota archaeon]
MIKKKYRRFFLQYVVLFGFLTGLFTAIGISPLDEVFSFMGRYMNFVVDNLLVQLVFVLMPLISFIMMVKKVYKKARKLGLAAVFVGYISGISVLLHPTLSLGLLLVAFVLAVIGLERKL